MASLYKRGSRYHAQWTNDRRTPSKVRLSLRTSSLVEARKALLKLDSRYQSGDWDPWVQTLEEGFGRPLAPQLLGDVVSRYLKDCGTRLSPGTVISYSSVLGMLLDGVSPSTLLANVDHQALAALYTTWEISRTTVRQRHNVLRAFFHWCVREGHLPTSPVDRIRAPRRGPSTRRYLGEGEMERICSAIRKEYRRRRALTVGHCAAGDLIWVIPIIRFTFLSGLRISEVAGLQWSDLSADYGTLHLGQQKNGRSQELPLASRAGDILRTLWPESRSPYVFTSARATACQKRSSHAFANRITKLFKRFREEAGLPSGMVFHSLRHGFCTALAEAGESAVVIKSLARHSSLAVSQNYVSQAELGLRARLDRTFGGVEAVKVAPQHDSTRMKSGAF